MGLPLSEKQQEIVESNEEKIVVISAAASGKSQILTERIRHLLVNGVKPKDIVAITFTNNAADVIKNRLGRPNGLFVGTIHSYANFILNASGYRTDHILEEEAFDLLFPRVEKHIDCIIPVKHLLLDEAQDSDELQFRFLFEMVKPENYFVVGDPRQSIYQWKGSNYHLLLDLVSKDGATLYNLNENYRNGKYILDMGKYIINQSDLPFDDDSIAMRINRGKVTKMEYNEREICNLIENIDDYKDWFVLCRSNRQVDEMCRTLKFHNIPCDTFKQGDMDLKELEKRKKENTVKILTVHSAKGLENENVVVVGCRIRADGEEACISYVAVTRAKKNLIWTYQKRKQQNRWKF